MDTILKGIMAGVMGFSLITLLFLAPNGWFLTSSVNTDKVEPKGGVTAPGTRGPRYIWVGGYYRGK